MKRHLRYLRYLARHKYFVFIECTKRGLVWRGLIHDWDKLLPEMWFAYLDFFYPAHPGDDDRSAVRDRYDRAWLAHQRRNAHHPQHHVLRLDDGETRALEMPRRARIEMLCDWIGIGRALSTPGVLLWYAENRERILLGEETRRWVEDQIGHVPDSIDGQSAPIVLRPLVRDFAEDMERKLAQNAHRGGWDVGDWDFGDAEYVWRRLHEAVGKLTFRLWGDRGTLRWDAVDVANFAMILTDLLDDHREEEGTDG